MPPRGLSPRQLDDIRARYEHARRAGEAAEDAGEGWDDAKRRALLASWQDIPDLWREVLRTREPDPIQALTVHWWGRQIPTDARQLAEQTLGVLERAGFTVRRPLVRDVPPPGPVDLSNYVDTTADDGSSDAPA